MSGLQALYQKEMADHIRSRRFLIVLVLIVLTSCAGIYGALSAFQGSAGVRPEIYLSEAVYLE